jgi:hypothetical protein
MNKLKITTCNFCVHHPQHYTPCTIFCLLIFPTYIHNILVTKIILLIFFTVDWFWHIMIVIVFLCSPPWRWPRVAKTCWMILWTKIKFIHSSAFVGLFLKEIILFIHVQNMEHFKTIGGKSNIWLYLTSLPLKSSPTQIGQIFVLTNTVVTLIRNHC